MRMSWTLAIALLAGLLAGLYWSDAWPNDTAAPADHGFPESVVISMPDRSPLSFQGLVSRLASADIVVLGEVHDNAEHHAAQAAIVRALNVEVGVAGLAFEMIRPDDEAAIARARSEGRPLADTLDWAGWPDFALYAPIFDAAPSALVTGGAFKREALRQFASDLGAWPNAERFQIDQPLPEAQMQRRMEEQVAAHCNAIPLEATPPMVAIQRLWDASFANAALRAWEERRGLVVVIAGTGHADRRRAVPEMLIRARPDLRVISVGGLESDTPPARYAADAFDFAYTAPPAEREDPCLGFKK
ncbi:MAG: ChaN family lipoprotein [Pseudomonadota bacterium]